MLLYIMSATEGLFKGGQEGEKQQMGGIAAKAGLDLGGSVLGGRRRRRSSRRKARKSRKSRKSKKSKKSRGKRSRRR
jgi:hypothetical protein